MNGTVLFAVAWSCRIEFELVGANVSARRVWARLWRVNIFASPNPWELLNTST